MAGRVSGFGEGRFNSLRCGSGLTGSDLHEGHLTPHRRCPLRPFAGACDRGSLDAHRSKGPRSNMFAAGPLLPGTSFPVGTAGASIHMRMSAGGAVTSCLWRFLRPR